MKKKKQGAVLVWVLAVFAVIIIVGTSVIYFISNSGNIDSNLYKKANADIICKAGIGVGESNIIDNSMKYKELPVGSENNIKYYLEGELININIKKIQDEIYIITASTKFKGTNYSLYGSLALNFEENKIIREVNAFEKNNAGIAVLNGKFNIDGHDSFFRGYNTFHFNNSTVNISGITTNYINTYLYNLANSSLASSYIGISGDRNILGTGIPNSKGLNLKFSRGTLNLNQGYNILGISDANSLYGYENILKPNQMILFGESSIRIISIDRIGKVDLSQYTGALIKLREGYALINNGNININGGFWSQIYYDFSTLRTSIFIYSTGTLNLNSAPMYLSNSSLIANNGINLNYSDFYNYGYFMINDKLNSILLNLVKK